MSTALTVLETERESLSARVQAVAIVSQESYNGAIELLRSVKALRKRIEEHHDPVIKAALNAHRQAISAKKSLDEPLGDAEGKLKFKITEWDREQERKRRDAQRKAEEQLRRQQEDEALKAAQDRLDNGGSIEEAEAVLDTVAAAPTPAVEVKPTYERAEGVSKTSLLWSAEVVDLRALVAAWLSGDPRVPTDAIQVNVIALNKLARAFADELDIPGVRPVSKANISVRV